MGTNYYMHPGPPCPTCHREFESRHIGKSSGGWCFAMHVYPDEGIINWEDWKALLRTPGVLIKDEYDRILTFDELSQVIEHRSWQGKSSKEKRQEYDVRAKYFYPYSSWLDFLDKNYAVDGPNGLIRSKIDGVHCIGHGEGTWDYLVGDFT